MKVINHHHRKLDKNRNNHSRSNQTEVQSFDHIHERHRHRHRQSDRDIRDDNHFFNVENDFHNNEQETSLFETHYEDHDLLKKNREIRFRFERN
jgi:hypothetical protein